MQVVDAKPSVARPVGLNSDLFSGTADIMLNSDMYSNDGRVATVVRGRDELMPTDVEIRFQDGRRYSGLHRFEAL